MSILKVIEIMANSPKSWEDAAQNAVADAAKTLKNIRSVYIKEQSVHIENDKIAEYRIIAKVTFEVDHSLHKEST